MTSRRSSNRLTLKALRQHDRLHTGLQAMPTLHSHTLPLPDHPNTKDNKTEATNESLQTTAAAAAAVAVVGLAAGATTTTTTATMSAANPPHKQPMKKHALTVFRLVTATRSWQRYTFKNSTAGSLAAQHVSYENTYRLEPDRGSRFSSARVEAILKDVLERGLKDVRYSAEECRRHATELVDLIKTRTKTCHFHRYKLVCNVLIMENRGQGSRVVSLGLTNADTDSFATYTFQSPTMLAAAYVHGLYFD